jgi:tetratricopeptide (TPR) repeat protein
MILYRSVGLQEMALIYDSGMKAFPARLPQQPIFYPVLELEYARQITVDWNARNGQFAGYVTQFKVEDEYLGKFETHAVGESGHEEFWIPAEHLEEFNQHLVGQIKAVEAYFRDGFQGFIPEQFGLQGKNAVEQFTVLTNAYLYKRVDFYLEIKRNHKAVFLNYPFWQKHDFKNPGLKEKILQAIKEAWFTSFPKNPLANSVQEETKPQTDSPAAEHPAAQDGTPVEQRPAPAQPVPRPAAPSQQPNSPSFVKPVPPAPRPAEKTKPQAVPKPVPEPAKPMENVHANLSVNPVRDLPAPVKPREPHFEQGVRLGLNGEYAQAREELSNAVQQDPDHIAARTSLGVAYHRLGDDDRALSCYESALKRDPKYAEAHYFRANVLYGQGEVREAIAEYTTAIGLDPELVEAHLKPMPQDRLADYTASAAEMYWIAKPARRILDLTKSLEANPGQANLYKERAAAYARLWNYEQAIVDYSACLKLQPDDASALHFRGLAYEQMGDHDRALHDYERAISIDPQLSDVYINRGVALGKMGNFRQSVASLSEAIRLAPQNPDGYFNRGMTYFQLGDLESAVVDFSHVIRLSPNDEAAYYWRGISNEEAGRQSEAISDYKQFLTLSQDARAKGEIEQRLSQWNQATQDDRSNRTAVSTDGSKTDRGKTEQPGRLDINGLLIALGDRALESLWFGLGVECYGEKAGELYALTDQNRPIKGPDLLNITAGIDQTVEGDFTAYDPDATSHWIFIRAWGGSGFYIETNDPKSRERLQSHFESVEEVEGAYPPYEGLFIHV